MGGEMVAAFTAQMAQLRLAIVEADPLAARAERLPAAEAVASAFAGATETERLRYLLWALDDAIAAHEVAARLAGALHGAGLAETVREPVAGEADPVRAAYQIYTESQPGYAALYHYRNTLARQLRVKTRPIPDAVEGAPPSHVSAVEKPPAKSGRSRKEPST